MHFKMPLVAPGCLYIFHGEKVNRNSPLRSQLPSNHFQQFCNTTQACYLPMPVFRITLCSILPRRRSTPSSSCSSWRAQVPNPRGTAQKDTSRDHRPSVHQSKGQLSLQEDHRGLDEVLPESQHGKR